MRILLIFSILFCSFANCAEFGEYGYSKYMGLQQQLQNRRIMAQRQALKYNSNPTRNIRYPSANNPYPNIQRIQYNQMPLRQRYSANYYRNTYY